jgi:hypothetical protein
MCLFSKAEKKCKIKKGTLKADSIVCIIKIKRTTITTTNETTSETTNEIVSYSLFSYFAIANYFFMILF